MSDTQFETIMACQRKFSEAEEYHETQATELRDKMKQLGEPARQRTGKATLQVFGRYRPTFTSSDGIVDQMTKSRTRPAVKPWLLKRQSQEPDPQGVQNAPRIEKNTTSLECFEADMSNEQLFNDDRLGMKTKILDIVSKGHEFSCFVYGYTGSGMKT